MTHNLRSNFHRGSQLWSERKAHRKTTLNELAEQIDAFH
jgi:hypothetical protein